MNWGINLLLSAEYFQNMVLAIDSKHYRNANAASVHLDRGYVSSDVRTQRFGGCLMAASLRRLGNRTVTSPHHSIPYGIR